MKRRRARLRPKVFRKNRSAAWKAAASIIAAVCLSWVFAKSWSGWLPEYREIPLPRIAAVESVTIVGAPDLLEGEIRKAIGWLPGSRWGLGRPGRIGRELMDRFSYLREARARRSWIGRSVVFEVKVRTPLARLVRKSREEGLLAEDGSRFSLPEQLYADEPLPIVDLGALQEDADLKSLGRMLSSAKTPGVLPSRMIRLGHVAGEAGWVAALEDGTRLLWGSLEFNDEKFMRLAQVLGDAEKRFGAGLTADLRHFEDGKILVRPAR